MYGAPISGSKGPTADNATIITLGAFTEGASGGQTLFSGTSSAADAQLIAIGGTNGGESGRITFYDESSGGAATVQLSGNGTLDISDYGQPSLTIGELELAPGSIETSLGTATTCLVLSGNLIITATPAAFYFEAGAGFAANTPHTILTAPNLSRFTAGQFTGNSLNQGSPTFSIVGNDLQVSFCE